MSFNKSGSKYLRAVPCITEGKIDVYAVLDAFAVTCPARQHAIKKLLCSGIRGKGDTIQDLKEAADAVRRAIQMEEMRLMCAAAIADVKRDMGEILCPSYIKAEKESLCWSCEFKGCFDSNGHTDVCPKYRAKEEPKAERKASFCHSCHAKVCSKERITACEESGTCAFHVSALRENMLDAKQEAPTTAVLPLDFTLPSITLKCTAEEAMAKFQSEVQEWRMAEEGGFHEMVERWDCLQALQTFYERGGKVAYYQLHVRPIMDDLSRWFAEGRDVMGAKATCLEKNARRDYYSPEVNAVIIASNGYTFPTKGGKP